MFNFLKSFIGAQSYLGVDLGTTSIKLVEISKGKRLPKLQNYGVLETYGHLERLNDAIQTPGLKIMERESAELLKFLLKKIKIKTKEAIASLPGFLAFITLLELPEMSSEETIKTLPFQVRQYIPLPISEVAIDWLRVGEKKTEDGSLKQQILVISVPNEHIQRYKDIFELAGLKLKALEIESLALIRSLTNNDPTPTLIVDIGARSTNLVAVKNGFLKYNSQTDFAGGSLTQAIASGLNINIRRAEELKKQKGILGGSGEYELSTLTIPFLDAIISEVKRIREIYEKNQESKIERVILAGGGANLLGIDKYFEQAMGLPVITGNSFSVVEYPAMVEPVIKELGPAFAVAIGLGIREFI